MLCPFKGHLPGRTVAVVRSHSNRTLGPRGIVVRADTKATGVGLGTSKTKRGGIIKLRVECNTSGQPAESKNPQVFTSSLERLKHIIIASSSTHCHPLPSPWTCYKLTGLCFYFGPIFHLRTRNCHQFAPLAAEPVTGQGLQRKGLWLN